MPGGDRTGPMGMGPMTGRGAGYCAGNWAPGFASPGPGLGRGFGRGWGRGFGWRMAGWPGRGYVAPQSTEAAGPWSARQITREEELDYLRNQADMLKGELDAIGDRIGRIESEQRSGTQEEE